MFCFLCIVCFCLVLMIIVTTNKIQSSNLKNKKEDFPGGPVTKICTPNAEGLSSIPGQGTRSHMLELRVKLSQLKDPTCCSADLTRPCSQRNR